MSDPNAAFALAVAKHQAGDVAGAERMYRDLLLQFPTHAPTLCNLGVLLVRAGQLDEAAACYQRALAASPGNADAHFNLGNLFRRIGRFREAADQYQACLSANPSHTSARYNFGLVLAAVGDLSGAAECFRAVIRLEPRNVDAHSRLGDALVRIGQLDDGVASFRKSVALKPDDPRGLYNLGLALSNIGRNVEAQELLLTALRLKPDYAEAHNALGLNLEALGRKDEAQTHYQQAVRFKPELADAWCNLGTNRAEQGRADDAIECLRESLRVRPQSPPVHSNLLLMLNYSSRLNVEQVRQEHFQWAETFAGLPRPAPPVPEPRDPNRRLRLGYLSADFRNHTVAGFIETLLRHHDRDRVEVYTYASVSRPDDTTERLRQLADQWRPIGGVPDEQAAEQIRSDRIDVLIDLGGHTAGNRLGVLIARPAPVQATLFGYPNTTGLRTVDYRLSDPLSDPPGLTDSLYAEQVLRLPEVAWVYAPPENAPPVTPLPAATNRPFTFGCLNNPAKISDACFETWAKLLQTIPGTRLVLLAGQSPAGAKRLADRFVKAGILRDRVELLFRVPKEKYFEVYGRLDLSLDPFPYNGGVTTGDSLWMGVPVLGVAGGSYVSRQGLMAMTTVGLPNFSADSPESLLMLVKEWTTRRDELAVLRAGLRERLRQSPLADTPRYVRNLEDALRSVWRERLPG